jgi:phage terminase large subunit
MINDAVDLNDLLSLSLVEIEKELFRRGDFAFIYETEKGRNTKQQQALIELTRGVAREVVYGGAAGGAKSWTGASYLTMMSICFPGTRWFAARNELTDLKGSTYPTFQKVFLAYGVKEGELSKGADVVWKEKDHYLQFANGSQIRFIEVKFKPSDRDYISLGSFEYTGGWIEEGGEVHSGAYDTLKTRIGRHLNDKYGIRPVLFITCNPNKNWLYYTFYLPWKHKELPANRVYIEALVTDNPAIDTEYIDQLRSITDKAKKERLLYANWDYDDDPAALVEFDAMLDLFTNDHVKPTGDKMLSADLAMKGRDRFVAGNWHGYVCHIPIDKEFSTGKMIEGDLKACMIANHVPRSKVVVDSDGLGSYLESYLEGIKEFHGGARAKDHKVYGNLKSECAYLLAALINQRKIKVICTQEQRQRIMEELGVLKAKDVINDTKRKYIISKDDMKDRLNRSPDYLDMLIMRMYFELYKGGNGSMAVE